MLPMVLSIMFVLGGGGCATIRRTIGGRKEILLKVYVYVVCNYGTNKSPNHKEEE
jgi:hypothetical protein